MTRSQFDTVLDRKTLALKQAEENVFTASFIYLFIFYFLDWVFVRNGGECKNVKGLCSWVLHCKSFIHNSPVEKKNGVEIPLSWIA